jgi:peptide/nickel transport system permease protein
MAISRRTEEKNSGKAGGDLHGKRGGRKNRGKHDAEQYYIASQYQLMWRRLRRHKLALIGFLILFILYFVGIFCEFFAPYNTSYRNTKLITVPPQRIHFWDEDGFSLRPFVYGYSAEEDPITWRKIYTENKEEKQFIRFFVHGVSYKMWGLIRSDLHLFGVEEGPIFLLGSDTFGRDLFSRILYGLRVSLSIGLIGVAISFVIGLSVGGLSGYLGGMVDYVTQRIIEFLRTIPVLPLWMALAAALPPNWPAIRVYFGITIIVSLIGWTGMARVVRSKLLSLRNEDFVTAAIVSNATTGGVIFKHLIPSFLSYVIVNLTLAIPSMILSETALSFLGLGLRPPVVSLGVLLNEAQNLHAVALAPWLLLPGLFIIISVLSFNFVGDGLRDAADPYSGA